MSGSDLGLGMAQWPEPWQRKSQSCCGTPPQSLAAHRNRNHSCARRQAHCQTLGDKQGWCLSTKRVSKLRSGGGVGLGDFSLAWQQLGAAVLGWDVRSSLRMSWEGG